MSPKCVRIKAQMLAPFEGAYTAQDKSIVNVEVEEGVQAPQDGWLCPLMAGGECAADINTECCLCGGKGYTYENWANPEWEGATCAAIFDYFAYDPEASCEESLGSFEECCRCDFSEAKGGGEPECDFDNDEPQHLGHGLCEGKV